MSLESSGQLAVEHDAVRSCPHGDGAEYAVVIVSDPELVESVSWRCPECGWVHYE